MEARQKEHEYFVSLNATLNSVDPLPCKDISQLALNKIPVLALNKIPVLSSNNLSCSTCNFNTCRQSQLQRHLVTTKHIKSTNISTPEYNKYQCANCDKIYKHHSSLWKHHKTCIIKKEKNNIESTDKEMILLLLQQNAKLIEQNSIFVKIITNIH